MSWETVILGDYAKVRSGYAFKSDSFRSDSGIPIIKIKNIQREYVEIDGEYFVEPSFLSIDSKFHCVKDDILISLTGSHITLPNSVVGRVAKYHYDFTSLLNQRGGKIVVTNTEKLENNYLYYYLCQSEIRIKLAQFGRGGANQCNISPSNVESIPLIIPPLPTQKRIASILYAYDDLIENNLKRIKLLEETAQNIYKEWFVHFRFPNYEHTAFDEESGLPVGWEMKTFEEVLDFKTGKLNSNANVVDGKYPFFTCSQEVFKTNTFSFDTEAVLLGGNNASANYPLKYFKGQFDAYQRTYIIKPKNNVISHKYIFLYLKERLNLLKQMSTGTSTKFLTLKMLNQMEILVMDTDTNQQFENIAKNLFEAISSLNSLNQKLKEARDILLPRLMNRTIEV